MLNIQDQRYGVEIEVVGAYRGDIAAAVAQATQGTITSTEVSRCTTSAPIGQFWVFHSGAVLIKSEKILS